MQIVSFAQDFQSVDMPTRMTRKRDNLLKRKRWRVQCQGQELVDWYLQIDPIVAGGRQQLVRVRGLAWGREPCRVPLRGGGHIAVLVAFGHNRGTHELYPYR